MRAITRPKRHIILHHCLPSISSPIRARNPSHCHVCPRLSQRSHDRLCTSLLRDAWMLTRTMTMTRMRSDQLLQRLPQMPPTLGKTVQRALLPLVQSLPQPPLAHKVCDSPCGCYEDMLDGLEFCFTDGDDVHSHHHCKCASGRALTTIIRNGKHLL